MGYRCPYCGSEKITEIGISDASDKYGYDVCPAYACDDCGANWEADCYGTSEDSWNAMEADEFLGLKNQDGWYSRSANE